MSQTTNAGNTDFAILEELLNHKFSDQQILQRALTHRSWAHENVASGDGSEARRLHSEAFEFLGDTVLGFVVAEYLLQNHEDATEGELSRMKHQLVSTTTLAKASKRLEFGKHLRFGRGEEKSGGRRKQALLADVFESVLAAIYLDGGIEPARNFVLTALEAELLQSDPQEAAAADHKTALQELLQAQGTSAPQYEVVETTGPPHRRVFHIEARWEGGIVRGEGSSIKAAETKAARRALEQLNTTTTEHAKTETATAD